MVKFKIWLKAFRLRTLPLSLSGIILGSLIAKSQGFWNSKIFIFSILTTVLFQILSNLANDLGDTIKGADNEGRVGPKRTVQEGVITMKKMKIAIYLFSVLSILSAVFLIQQALIIISFETAIFYFVLAILCIIAAISYTIGKKAYGYHGFGDVFVFVFFGLVSVLGVYTLYSNEFSFLNFLPAMSVGALSTAVLNLNNLRDQENDKKVVKNTIVVRLGFQKAKLYHSVLIISPIIFMLVFSILTNHFWAILSLLVFIPLIIHLKFVNSVKEFKDYDSQLKKVALITFFFSIIYGLLINLLT